MKRLIAFAVLGSALSLGQAAMAQTGEELFKSAALPCQACHAVDVKKVGPSFKEVAAKHAGQKDAVATLVAHIKGGSQGVYGPIPMPPNNVTDEQATSLAKWVLSIK